MDHADRFIEEQNKKLAEMISQKPRRPIQSKNHRFSLRKLPLWGKTRSYSKIDFEWPTQAILDRMPADVRLQSLDFKRE